MSERATLAFWAKAMSQIHSAGMSWPGFSYTDPEKRRLAAIANSVSDGRYLLFQAIGATLFIVLAALCIAGLFLPVLTALYPDPAQTPALAFVCLLAAVCALTLGFGIPLSMRVGAALVPAEPEDTALAAKMRRQIWRMTLIMCGVLVPGTLLFIAFNIQAGPLITALKWACLGLMVLSTWSARRLSTAR